MVFYWLTLVNTEWKQFVQNRVNAIKKLIPVESWRHCPGHDNPADLPSRGMSSLQLLKEPSWLGAIGHRLLSLPGGSDQEDISDPGYVVSPSSATDLVRRLRHLNKVMDHFWQRWRKEYLIELRDCHRRTGVTSGSHPPVMVGDIILVHDQDHPRTFWRLGKVENLIESFNNKVRGARVRVGSKSGRSSILRRAVQLHYPLEVQCSTETQLSEPQ